MESSEIYNNLIQVRKISQLQNINDFTNYNDEDILFVIAAYDKTLAKWSNFSVNKGVLINLLNHINLDAIRQEIEALRELLDLLHGKVSNYEVLASKIESLEEKLNEFYSALYIDELISNYYTKQEVDNKFQPKGNYLTEHPSTGSVGHTMKIPEGHYISGITFDDYGHVIDIETSELDQTPKIIPIELNVTGCKLSQASIRLGETRPTIDQGTVKVTYSNGTSKEITNYTFEEVWPDIDQTQEGTYQVIAKYKYIEDDVTLTSDVEMTLNVGQLDSITVGGTYGFSKTTFGKTESLTTWNKGTVTAKYTKGLSNKTVTTGTTITEYTSSDTNVIDVSGTTLSIRGIGTTTISATYSYTEHGITKTVTKTQNITVENDIFYVYVGPEEITKDWETNVYNDTSFDGTPTAEITNIGWTKLPGKVSEVKINVLNDSKVYWCVAIPSSLGIKNVTDAGETLEGFTKKVVTTTDGIEYNVWIQGEPPTKSFDYTMK